MDLARQQTIVSRRNLESSELRVRESVVQTTAAVKQAYWTLKATLANVTVQQRSLELAQELVRQNKARVDIGQTPPLDLLQAEAEVAQRRENLIRANTAAGDAEDRLRRLIMDPADVVVLANAPRSERRAGRRRRAARCRCDRGRRIRRALRSRAGAKGSATTSRRTSTSSTTRSFPTFAWKRRIAGNGLGGTRFLRTGGFPGTIIGNGESRLRQRARRQMFGSTYPTWSVGLTVSYSLGRSFEEAGLARAQVERRQATQRIASLQLQIGETLRQAVRQVQSTARAHRSRSSRSNRGAPAARRRAAAIRGRALDELSRHAGAARSPADRGEPAAGDARPSVGARQLRSAAAGAGIECCRGRAESFERGSAAGTGTAGIVSIRCRRWILILKRADLEQEIKRLGDLRVPLRGSSAQRRGALASMSRRRRPRPTTSMPPTEATDAPRRGGHVAATPLRSSHYRLSMRFPLRLCASASLRRNRQISASTTAANSLRFEIACRSRRESEHDDSTSGTLVHRLRGPRTRPTRGRREQPNIKSPGSCICCIYRAAGCAMSIDYLIAR